MIPSPDDQFTTAPAAFGVTDYNHSSSPVYPEVEYQQHASYYMGGNFEVGESGTFFEHTYPPMDNSWIQFEEPTDYPEFAEKEKYQTRSASSKSIDCLNALYGYGGMESGQTMVIENPSISLTAITALPTGRIKRASMSAARSSGLPTNITADGKVDRKTLKRMRNRVSASRCRSKKKEWITDMEDESQGLDTENRQLQKKITALEESLSRLKQYHAFEDQPLSL